MTLPFATPLYMITCAVGGALSVDPARTDAGGQVVLQDPSEHSILQRWSLYYNPAVQGAVLYNPFLNLYAAAESNNNGAKVMLYDFDPKGDFSGRTWQFTGVKDAVIRLQANNDLNLNAAGGSFSPGTPVIVWTWSGDKNNMLWNTTLMFGASAAQAA